MTDGRGTGLGLILPPPDRLLTAGGSLARHVPFRIRHTFDRPLDLTHDTSPTAGGSLVRHVHFRIRLLFFAATTDFGGGGSNGGESDSKQHGQPHPPAKESDSSSNVSDIKLETGTGSSLSNYRYKVDYGGAGPDSMTATTTIDDQLLRSATPKSGGGGSQTTLTRVGGGIPLAGPVPVDPRAYATVGYHPNGTALNGPSHHRPLSNGSAIADYVDPLNYVRYNNNNNNNSNGSGSGSNNSSVSAIM